MLYYLLYSQQRIKTTLILMTKNQKKNLNFLQRDTTTRLQRFALTVAHSTIRVS